MRTLAAVIKSYLNEAELSEHQMMRFLEIGKRGIMDLHMDVSGLPTTVQLDFNENTLTSNLPADYITYKKIGYEAAGVIVPFAQNPRIKLYADDGACLPDNQNKGIVNTTGAPSIDSAIYPYWGFGAGQVMTVAPNGALGGFSNLGGNANFLCDFRIDELNGYVQYGSNPGVTIWMEYLANPKKVNGKYVVHPFDDPALMAWIGWRDIANKKGVPMGLVDARKREYYRERGQSRKRHYEMNITNAYQKARLTNKAAPQF